MGPEHSYALPRERPGIPELGEVGREFFGEYIYPHFGAERDDVRLASEHGVDPFWAAMEQYAEKPE